MLLWVWKRDVQLLFSESVVGPKMSITVVLMLKLGLKVQLHFFFLKKKKSVLSYGVVNVVGVQAGVCVCVVLLLVSTAIFWGEVSWQLRGD